MSALAFMVHLYLVYDGNPPRSLKGFPFPEQRGQTNCRPECSESVEPPSQPATMLTVSVQENFHRTLLLVTIIYQAQRKKGGKMTGEKKQNRNKETRTFLSC